MLHTGSYQNEHSCRFNVFFSLPQVNHVALNIGARDTASHHMPGETNNGLQPASCWARVYVQAHGTWSMSE